MLFKKKENPSEMLPAVQVVSGGVYFGIIKTTSPIRIEGDFKGIIFCTNKVIIDKKEAGRWLGRTQFDSVEVDNEVVINTTKRLKSGDMVMVKITKAYDYDLEGELV